jgi:prepilin-type processing-associated H-X9-DG protein
MSDSASHSTWGAGVQIALLSHNGSTDAVDLRHNIKSNVVFGDGHAKSLTRSGLRQIGVTKGFIGGVSVDL